MKKLALAAFTIALFAPASSSAQGPKWRGWTGCWSIASERPDPLAGQRLVCVAPLQSADAVELIAVNEGDVVSRDTIDAGGRAIPVMAKGCTGTRAATWSSDQRRVYLTSDVECDGLRTNVSAILAMTERGEWLDVRRIAAGGGSDLRVARYRDAGIPGNLPADIASRLRARDDGARIASGAPSGGSAVIDASRALHADVVEAWVYESGERFAANGDAIKELASAGVPGNVTDAIIATSDAPSGSKVFVSDYLPGYGRGSEQFWDQGTGMRLIGAETPMYDPWGFGYGPFGDRVYNAAVDGMVLGYRGPNQNGRGRGLGYGPNGIGWGFGYGYYRKAPTGKSLISYYAPDVPVLQQGAGGETRTSLSAPAYPDQPKQQAPSAKSGGGVMESVGKAIVDAATGKAQGKQPTKPR
jgi:hypothetical protein